MSMLIEYYSDLRCLYRQHVVTAVGSALDIIYYYTQGIGKRKSLENYKNKSFSLRILCYATYDWKLCYVSDMPQL